MSVSFDRLTEGERERELMRAVRARAFGAEELAERCLRFPLKIQIQTASPCNAACAMCPWPETATSQPQGRMREELYESLLHQLAGRGVERTSLFLMNEPLVDRRLEAWCARLKQVVPETRALIYTNGELLSPERARALVDAGLDEIDISVIGFDPQTYARHMRGLDYGRVMAHLDALGALAARGELGALRLRIVALDLPGVAEGVAAFRERTGLDVYLKPCTNRAGNVGEEELHALGAALAEGASFSACQRPFVKAYVLYNGDVALCNCDWRRSTILGNLERQSLEQIWNGPALRGIRRQHLEGSLAPRSLCAGCDYPYQLDAD